MTDEALKDLVLKHDHTIENLANSVEALVNSNTETNKRLEEISRYLAKQAVFDTKLADMDKDISESFQRVHKRIDEVDNIQKSNDGCKSVQLLHKDVTALTKTVSQLAGTVGDIKISNEHTDSKVNSLPTPKVIAWVAGFSIAYLVSFGVYVVQQLHESEVIMTTIKNDLKYRSIK